MARCQKCRLAPFMSQIAFKLPPVAGCRLREQHNDFAHATKERLFHASRKHAASAENALDMGSWHVCETTHCRAGWVTHLAGDAGRALEQFHNTELAAMLIYRESSPIKVEPWKFYQTSDDAMADMKRCAEEEASARDGTA